MQHGWMRGALAFVVVGACAAWAVSQDAPPQPDPHHQGGEGEGDPRHGGRGDHDAMEKAMKTVGAGFKHVSQVAERPELLEDVAWVTEAFAALQRMQHAMVDAKGMTPTKVARVDDAAERETQVREYHKQMLAFGHALLSFEEALLAKDAARLKELTAQLDLQKKTGHDAFKGGRRRGGRGRGERGDH